MNAYPERMNRMSCQFAQNPGVIHWRTVKRILRYLTNPLSSNPVQHHYYESGHDGRPRNFKANGA